MTHGKNTRNISDALELAEVESLADSLREHVDSQSAEWRAAGDWEAVRSLEAAEAGLEARAEELRLRLEQTEERSLRNLSERLSLPLPPLGGMWTPAASEVNREAEQLGAEMRSQRAGLSEELRLQFLRRSSVSRSELEEGFPL